MKNRIHFLPLAAALLAIILPPLQAQVPDGASNTYNSATNVFANTTVGTNGPFTLLVLGNNALLTNLVNGVIGLNATAKSNEVRLISPTARWLMGNFLYVGSNGSFNRLVVSNGALVRSVNGYLGPYLPASNNVAIITGAGSTWSNNNVFYLGFNGAGNQLVVSNGGTLRANGSLAGVNTASSNNFAIVTGAGSLWSNATSLQFGNGGPGNQLVISNGGVVRSSLGLFGGGVSASNTVVTVTGSGSLWTNTTDFYVGQSSVGNQLFVSNGGVVRNGHGYVGANFTGSNNVALITGAGSVWSNALDLNVGAYSGFNQAIASNGATIFVAGNGFIGPTENGNGNMVTVSGSSSRWLIGTNLYVGSNGALSRLVVSNGGLVVNTLGTVGRNISSSNNVALVTGAGSTWSNSSSLYFGYSGRSNQLLISNGAKVRDSLSYVGVDPSSSNNLVVVNGPGSAWEHAFELYFGLSSAGNQLVVSNGGAILDTIGVLGSTTDGNNNSALVTGPGSIWSNTFELYVGSEGTGNQLTVSNGGAVRNSIGTVGYLADSNAMLVTDAGSLWTNSLNLVIGNMASRNQMVVSNGAAVVAGGNGLIGYDTGANSNAAMLTGAGSRWLLNSNLYVGSNGALNRLLITNGAWVADATGTLGHNASSSNNLAVITGAGSGWSNTGDLYVGLNGRGNQLVVSSGATVWDAIGEIGRNSTSNNLAWVTGTGSAWNNTDQLMIGRSGSFNLMVVSNGGFVSSSFTYFSVSSAASNNSVLVTGSGSAWSNAFGIYLGLSGRGNRLEVHQGGLVQDRESYLGFDSSGNSSSNNLAVVTDPGSLWTNVDFLGVGYSSVGNQLIVSNSGTVFAGNSLVLGVFSSATNNRVEINNGFLLVSNALGNGVFDIRRGTNVLNAGLIRVDQLIMTNAQSRFEFNGGTLSAANSVISHGTLFRIGNGVTPATFILEGNGVHNFTGTLAAQVVSNATLTGNGTIIGPLAVASGGTLVPGASIGRMIFSNAPSLQGTVIMEISRNGSVLTNDQIQAAGTITYGGSLMVTNIGSTTLAAGDRFQLFTAGVYVGSFASVSLPPLGFNLSWTNKLAVDGSIEVVSGPIPQFTGITRSGTNLVLTGTGGVANTSYVVLTATNAAQPLTEWTSIATNQFGAGGSFSFTNRIDPGTGALLPPALAVTRSKFSSSFSAVR